ncbi:hypothetical protein [Virgisporangium aurantiacum]|uniref:Uncharacterized protein n=1 Tax=Virgisporangium aurantiacum TaxID=175570 RepID=A0A8J3ZFW8_9ACTN|nr:hypothetical protein [Virgisporangium aurantiacum]GIJ61125.1 hypothetical protein Vau01_086410 [Virgisporangium aurantiacum]
MKRRIAAFLASVAVMVALSMVVLPSSPAQAAPSCIFPTISLYPGEAGPNLRYGEVSVSFVVCNNRSPHDWTADVTKSQVNTTGKNLGFFIDGVNIRTTFIGDYSRYWTLTVNASTCVPRVGWPCHATYTLTAEFQGNLEYYTYPAVYLNRTTGYLTMVLFRTP